MKEYGLTQEQKDTLRTEMDGVSSENVTRYVLGYTRLLSSLERGGLLDQGRAWFYLESLISTLWTPEASVKWYEQLEAEQHTSEPRETWVPSHLRIMYRTHNGMP